MKVTKEKAAENRTALIRAASKKFREHGIDGIGVAEIAKCAGLTQGALYAQFESKQHLAAEALAYGLERSIDWMSQLRDGQPLQIGECLDMLVSRGQRDDIGGSCPIAASASELARQDVRVSACFAQGLKQQADIVERAIKDGPVRATNRQKSLMLLASIVGGVAVARAVAKADPSLSDEIIDAVRAVLGEIGGEDSIARSA